MKKYGYMGKGWNMKSRICSEIYPHQSTKREVEKKRKMTPYDEIDILSSPCKDQ